MKIDYAFYAAFSPELRIRGNDEKRAINDIKKRYKTKQTWLICLFKLCSLELLWILMFPKGIRRPFPRSGGD